MLNQNSTIVKVALSRLNWTHTKYLAISSSLRPKFELYKATQIFGCREEEMLGYFVWLQLKRDKATFKTIQKDHK